ncbi:MAG: hypothetical protein JWR21_1482 [Herminiimonas sp.]|nr:hypothetical protein [Herminiimonas sp.]
MLVICILLRAIGLSHPSMVTGFTFVGIYARRRHHASKRRRVYRHPGGMLVIMLDLRRSNLALATKM